MNEELILSVISLVIGALILLRERFRLSKVKPIRNRYKQGVLNRK
jgi:hypothetical protein